MANLNFQQPPRSIANSSLNNRGGVPGSGYVGAGSNSLSGHVTPTSSMFQQNANFAPLSPNRSGNMQLGGGLGGPSLNSVGSSNPSANRVNIFGQRAFTDRRQLQGLGPMVSIWLIGIMCRVRARCVCHTRLMSSLQCLYIYHLQSIHFIWIRQSTIGSFMQSRGYGSQGGNNALNSFHSVFGNNDTGTPPLLDLSEFPSLTNARGNDSMPQSNTLQPPGSKPYGNCSFNFYNICLLTELAIGATAGGVKRTMRHLFCFNQQPNTGLHSFEVTPIANSA